MNIILIPKIGFYGAAVARLACYSLMCILCLIGNRHFPIPYEGKKILIYIGLALLIFIICFYTHYIDFYKYLLRIVLIGYFILFFLNNEKILPKVLKKKYSMRIKILNRSKHPYTQYTTELSAGLDLRANIDVNYSRTASKNFCQQVYI